MTALKRAADLIVQDFSERGPMLGKDQQEGFSKVLGHVIEHLDSLQIVRHGMLTVSMKGSSQNSENKAGPIRHFVGGAYHEV
ncbi:hypothetical protein KDX27_39210 [Burkholderia cenocepacia]|uniref:hypothetical protein n=1 Tax=Burkholderia cenocepacia TaxID=95486 RepID=UPI001B9D35CE|nr:hypothetical protein [Burkholderia cenocepacia]MBR8029930.1 hypothetical protein [Burkholderia cenocepacia]MBR8173722.1 hypothetical protein [Burkholderia cenocepacia]